jgi:beta-lactamase regulating signal transducer with metallopeptidase domain
MDRVFLTILNMSLTGSFVIVIICLARLPLKNVPKIISYCLWAAAGFRLVFPFSIEGMFSLIPFKSQVIPPDIATRQVPQINSGVEIIDNFVSGALPVAASQSSANPLQIWTAVGAVLWLIGIAVMLFYGVASYLSVRGRMRKSVYLSQNVFEAENIESPFVLGLITPKIYIPSGLSLKEREYILLHEQTHVRRHDHIIKLASYLILCLYWFNPLAWVAFFLMGVDMEMSCDERVLKELGGEIKKDYSMSLLSLAMDRQVVSGSPLAFGEDGVKRRIQNVLTFKTQSRTVIVLAVAFVTVLSLGLMVSRSGSGDLNNPDYATSGSAANANANAIYLITDYYNEDGKFSDLGLALPEIDSARVLIVNKGDIIVAGDRQYEVKTESLTLSYYTQPSREMVIQWWIDYLDSWAEGDKVMPVSSIDI